MPQKGPHISIDTESLVNRILRINAEEFAEWPEGVRNLTLELAGELFLVCYNPFINVSIVRESVNARFEQSRRALAHHYANTLADGLTMFWSAFDNELAFRTELISRLEAVLPKDRIDARPHSRVESATDATDLRMELPLLVVAPASAEEVSAVVKLANEMQFALVPRGGASGLTGGAIPARKRTVVLSLTRMNTISTVDAETMTITAEAGAITNDVRMAALDQGFLFSIDPASKTASTIGGNIAENSGGPLCFEYGTTIDNVLSYTMVTPTGEIILIERMNHPRHKIYEDETAVFEVRDVSGGVRTVVRLNGNELRSAGLGKDVTNKALGGLPGMQKEGVDGIIVAATFVVHRILPHSRVLVLEFYGRSMTKAMEVIKSIVSMRNEERKQGDTVKITALEEFGSKYVDAIEYKKKSTKHEGDPISVLILQLESDDETALDSMVSRIREICGPNEAVDYFVARDGKEAELFWEDRHRLSAIAKRTSGFKINEDVVIPIDEVPRFAKFIEQINLEGMARSFRRALQEVGRLPGFPEEDKEMNREFSYASKVIKGEVPSSEVSDQEMELRAVLYLKALREQHPALAKKIDAIEQRMHATRIIVANHMHAGDGNCHVNIPVNSNDQQMLHDAEKTAQRVMARAQEIGGEVSGEHGIGITKIAFLSQEKIDAIKEVKRLTDPRNIMNPAKLTQRELPVAPFTFSFNSLIQDIRESGIEDKERLISLLANVQICTRCGKCKQVCPMHFPSASLLYQPRNKNLVLGALIEAIYYTQINKGSTDPALLAELRGLMEHCTGCGKCMAVCPVKIDSASVALTSRAILEREKQGGHPIKTRVLEYMAKDITTRVPKMARLASTGQRMQNKAMGILPAAWRKRFENPLFAAKGPLVGYRHLSEVIRLDKGTIFMPAGTVKGTVLYFPGCAASLFFRSVGLAGIMLCLRAGFAVILPEKHLCCGYPLLASGMDEQYQAVGKDAMAHLKRLCAKAAGLGLAPGHLLTACGTCRESMHKLAEEFASPSDAIIQQDVVQFLTAHLAPQAVLQGQKLLYHAPCHAEWSGVRATKAADLYAGALENMTGASVAVSPLCCGESGMGAMTSPAIFNKIRDRKASQLATDFTKVPENAPILVGCPSCKQGISRTLIGMQEDRPVLHTLEFLANTLMGEGWRGQFPKLLRTIKPDENGIRRVDLAALGAVELTDADNMGDDDH
ncbi:4Fe-4S binding domain protein [uncultured delta proteobacterium]|uniref:4Fe-4S binding domain protein n=1 Tax=uncultured delta proteobacterium TaxID=34034 RepID=A0A212J738_9DELT|nr:4Fe-4S binding domain protein [uncultured delta proteobacterium]